MVNLEKTIEKLLLKFKSKESYEYRKIVFWFDSDKTAEENILDIQYELEKQGIKTVILNNNFFKIKKIIEQDFPENDFLIYSPESQKSDEDNGLLDILLYSSRFENNKVSDVKSIFEIDGNHLDKFIEEYYNFFNSQKRIEPLKHLYNKNWNDKDFLNGFLAVITKTKVLDINLILRSLLIKSLDEDKNAYWKEIEKFNLNEYFWETVNKKFNYTSKNPTLKKFFQSLIITHIKKHTGVTLKGYSAYINADNEVLNPNCEVFLNNWLRDSRDFKKYQEYSIELFEDEKKTFNDLKGTFLNFDIEKLKEVEALNFFEKAIILNIVTKLTTKGQDYQKYLSLIDSRKNKVWYLEENKNYYGALENAVKLYGLINSEQIEQSSLDELYKGYKQKYYLADLYYRKFYEFYDHNTNSDVLKKTLRPDLEKLYHNKYLERFFEVWSHAITIENMENWKIGSNYMQNEFYNLYAKQYVGSNNRLVVIISDGLRYEVSKEIQYRLKRELRGTSELKDLVGTIPAVTKTGMASLLPHEKITYKNGNVFCDDISIEGFPNRDKILKTYAESAVALDYNTFIRKTRDEKIDELKGKNLVYIYHNKIDASGDGSRTEDEVFNACGDAVDDICSLIRELCNSISVTNIIVTSDHGFMYQRESLDEFGKVQIPLSKDEVVESDKRYLITSKDLNIENTHKFKLNYGTNEFIYIPKGPLRFKTKGSGIKYVHGGLSPQEIIIPVLLYKHIRSDKDLDKKQIKRGYAEVTVLNKSRRITNNIVTINLFQIEALVDKMEPVTCRLSIVDPETGKNVSDEKVVSINSVSEDPNQRKYPVTLTLKSGIINKKYNLIVYYIEKETEDMVPFDVNLAFNNDFDDF